MEFKQSYKSSAKLKLAPKSNLDSYLLTSSNKGATRQPYHALFTNKKITTSLSVAGVLAAGIIIYQLSTTSGKQAQNSFASSVPSYETVLPTSKSIEKLGGWQQVNPPGENPVFAYTDHIGDISVTVSQQPMPAPLNGDVSDLAKSYNATDTIDANGIKAHIGTSAKGPQSVIFTKDDLLILIKSQDRVDHQSWIEYISSLN